MKTSNYLTQKTSFNSVDHEPFAKLELANLKTIKSKFFQKSAHRLMAFFMFVSFMLSFAIKAKATTYYSFTSGSPSTLALWWTATNGTGTHPANFTTAGDIFEIQSGNTMTTTGNWAVTGTLQVDNGGVFAATSTSTTITLGALIVNAGGIVNQNRPLTVSGASSISGTINFASTSTSPRAITLTGDVTLYSTAVWNEPATGNGATNTYNFGGNFTNNALTFNAVGTGVHTFNGTAKTISGSTITSIASVAVTGTPTNTGTLTVRTALTGAGNLTNGNGTATSVLNINGTATITTLTATAANNTVNYTGALQTAKVATYNNLTLSGSAAKTFATTPTVNGILSMEGTASVVVTTGVVTYGTNATLQYNKPALYTATAEEWITPFVATGGIVIKNVGPITTPGAVQIGNNTSVTLNINSGATLTPGANLITLHGDFVNAGTFTSGAGGITIAGTYTTQSIAGFTTTGTVTLSKTAGTATFAGNLNAAALTINGTGGTLNLGSALTHTFTGIVTLTAGTLNGGSSTLNVSAISATAWNGTGSVFTAGSGTVNFGGGGAQTLSSSATTFNNLTISNSGLKTFSNTPTVNGVLSMEGTATVSAAPTYGSSATLQYNTSTSRVADVEWITPFVASGGVIIGNTGTISMNAAKVFNSTAPLTVNASSILSMSTYLLTLNGNLINNGSISGTTGGVTIAGTASQSIGAFTTTGTVSMTKTGGTATLTGNINGAGLTINGSGGTLNLGVALTHTFTGDVTLTAGTLNGGSSALNENNVSATSWNGTGSVFTASAGTVNFGAAGNQTIAANSTFYNLGFLNSGNKTLSNVTTINNNLAISGTAVADLGLGSVNHTCKSLTFSGSNQLSGTWGGTASTPGHVNNTYFLSTATRSIDVNCLAPTAPTSGGDQTICSGATIPSLSVTVPSGTADWYNQASGGTLLTSSSLAYTPSGAGTFYAETNNSGCLSATRTSVTLTVNPNPTLLSLSGSIICVSPGNNGTITSTTSQSGINYQLYDNGNSTIQSAKSGTGSGLSWTGLSAGNGYYVKGTNATTGCYSSSSTVNITTNTNPAALTLTGSTICVSPGGDGTVTSSTSVSGINYQLYDGSNSLIQSPLAGTGSAIQWSGLAAGSGYYAISTNSSTSCVSGSSNAVNVTTNTNPVTLVLTGSTICASPGDNGTITSSTSQTGVDYQLYDNTDLEVGTPIAGTGSAISWTGLSVATGLYAIGTNATTGCVTDLSNAVNISSTANPTITSSSTAAAVCFNTSSQNSSLSYSATTGTPTNFTITWNAAAHTAGLIDVTTTTLPSSPITIPVAANIVAGTYTGTLTVTNAASCASSGNNFNVTVNAAPSAPTGGASQTFCSGATVASLAATGTSVLWYAASSGGSSLATSTTLVNGTHYYASQTVSGCESSSRLNVTAKVIATGSWMGTTSTNWFTTTNWCGGAIPTASTNVTISTGLSNYPSIGTTGAVCNNITIEAGASLTITSTNTLTVSGNWSNSGTFNANSSTVDFNGSGSASIGTSNFNNITFSGAGTKTATGILTIVGNVSITHNFTAGAFTHSVSGTWTNGGSFTATGSTIDFTGSSAKNIGTSNFNNVTFSGSGVKTATGILTIAGNVSITGSFTAGAFTHTVGGNWSKSGTFTATGSTIDFNGAGAATIGASNFNNLTFSGAGTKTATGILSIVGNLTIGNNFSAGSYNHTLQGNFTNNGTFTANTSTILFNGSSTQNINGSSSSTFNNLTQNGAGAISLGIATSISGTLTLTLGILDISTYDLTINSGGSISGGSATSYVKTSSTGRLKQSVAGSGSVTKNFPVGNSAYNPMSVKYNDVTGSDYFSIRVADGAITNANSSKTINRMWYFVKQSAGSSDLTLTATYNAGVTEEGSGFSNSSSPQIGFFDGTSWAYRAISSGSGTTTFTASGSAPDFSNTAGFFALGSGDAFNATKLAVTNINPTNPSVGIANTAITIQAQNYNSVPTMVATATDFSLTATNTAMSTSPTGTISQYAYQTIVSPITFTASTYNSGTSAFMQNAFVTATVSAGESLDAGSSSAFYVYEAAIYEPIATENWDATNGWRVSTNGGSSWTTATLPGSNVFANNDLIRIPSGITLTANVTASFYSMLVYGTLDVNSSGNLTLNHSSFSDYNIHVHGTLKNSGGTITNSNTAYPLEIHGGTYWHNMNGGSIPVSTWSSLGGTPSTCNVTGITSTALTSGLNQTFENFTWNNASQTVSQTLTADLIINGTMTLTAGIITTGSYHTIVGLNGSASNSGAGYINGNLRRYVASTVTTGDFPVGDATHYAPFSITVASGTPTGSGYIDVSTSAAQPAFASGLSQTKYVNRKWTVTNNGVGGITAYSPSFTYAGGDLVGSPTAGSLKLRKLTSTLWYTTNGTVTGSTMAATGLSTAGLTATSDFYIGEDDCGSGNAIWLGSTSTDWNTAGNWCSGAVPTATTDVTIPSAPSHQPIIGSAGGTCKNITIQSGASLSYTGAYALDVKGNWSNSGTFTAGTGTVSFTSTGAQTITGTTTFNNLTINNTSGVSAANDLTVNGILTLTSSNPDDTHGTLAMGSYTLNITNASASVVGNGDVTGIVKRTHTFTPNVEYQFGSEYTALMFLNAGTQPSEVSCRISIGSAPSWKTGAIQRYYSFAQTGTTGTDKVSVRLRYLSTELNSNDATKLVLYDNHASGSTDEHGKSNNNTSSGWVELSGLSITYIAPIALDNKTLSLANYSTTKNTWTGASSTNWNDASNWSAGHIPFNAEDILIPDLTGGTNRYPVFADSVEVKSVEISVNASISASTYDLYINGYTGAWQNSGTFYPGSGTVYLTNGNISHTVSVSGTTQFNNIIIAANTFVRLIDGTYIKISGNVFGDLSCIVDLSATGNTVEYNGANQYIVNPSTVGYAGTGYYNLIFSNTGTDTLVDNLDVAGNFTNNGAVYTGTGKVSFVGTTAQTISGTTASTFNKLTINNAAGVSSATDLTVNDSLILLSENPSTTAGTLAMNSSKVLYMGVASTTTGPGDVTGIITRTHTFSLNTQYTFGNENTYISFPAFGVQTLPTSASLKVTIGAPPSWGGGTPANGINRILDLSQTGGSGTRALLSSHYLSNEVPVGVNQNLLSMWIYKSNIPYIYEKGKSGINTSTGYITVQDVDLSLIPSNLTDFHVAFAPTIVTTLTWNGNVSNDWTSSANWTPNGTPTGNAVLIPDANTTPNSPEIAAGASCKSITIESFGVLNTASGATLSLTGYGNVWNMQTNGQFNAGNSSVTISNASYASNISGNINFYNLEVANSAVLALAINSNIGIAGTITLTGSGTLDAATNSNTINFNGNGAQTIPALNYYNLTLSGDRSTNNITLASNGTIGVQGSLALSATFSTGNYITTSSTVSFNGISGVQNIPGFKFNNLTVNNSAGINMVDNDTVTSTLTFTSGKITTGSYHLVVGSSSSCSSGTITGAAAGKYVYGNLRRYISNSTDPSVTFNIGDASYYTPATVAFTGTTTGCGYLDMSTIVAQPQVVSGISQTKYVNRKWMIENTGVTGFSTFDLTFNFVSTDIMGGANPSAFVVRKYNGSAWYSTSTGTRTSTSTQCTGMISFSDFVIGEDECGTTDLWFGGVSTDWMDGANWCSGIAPSSSDNIVIQSGTLYQPHISVSGNGTCNNITINSSATLTMDGAYSLSVAGNWINNGSFIASTSTVNFNGSSAQTIAGATTFEILKVNNTNGVTLTSPITLTTLYIGDITSSSIFNDGGYQITSTGTLNLQSGTLKIGNGASATNYPSFATNTISSGTTIDYGSTALQTIAALNYNNITNSGNGNRTLASSGTISISGALTTGSGSYSVTGSTIDFNGTSSQNINGITYNNLTISGAGNNSKIATGDITVNGVLNLSSVNYSATQGALHMVNGSSEYVLTMGGTATTTGTGDVTGFVKRTSFELNTEYTFGNQFTTVYFTVGPVPNSMTLELYLNTVHTWKSNAINRYYDAVQSGGSAATRLEFKVHYLDAELNGATESDLVFFDYHVAADMAHDHGRSVINTADNWVEFTNIGLLYMGTASNDDHFWTLGESTLGNQVMWMGGSASGNNDWDLPDNWAGGVPVSTTNAIINTGRDYYPTVPTGAMPDGSFSSGRVINSLQIESGATVNATGSPTLTIIGANAGGYAWINHGTFNAGSSSVEFNSSSAQILGGSAITTFNNISIKGGGTKTLAIEADVNGTLTFDDGLLNSDATNILVINDGGIVSGASDNSFVNGPIEKIGNDAFVFPVGKSVTAFKHLQAIAISAPGSITDAFTAEYQRLSPFDSPLSPAHVAPLTTISKCEYWTLDRTTGNSNVDVTLYGNAFSGCESNTGANYFGDLTYLRVAHWNGSAWEQAAALNNTSFAGTSPNITLKANAVSSFSPFTFGGIGNPLPVKLISFTATKNKADGILNWSTATEMNNDHFDIERSIDGIHFDKIGEVAGSGTSFNIKKYSYADRNITSLIGPVLYYRLRQVDYSGVFEYSMVRTINLVAISSAKIVNQFPNPFTDELTVTYNSPVSEVTTITVSDAFGRVLDEIQSNSSKGLNNLKIDTRNYAAGLYMITISCNGTAASNCKVLKAER